MANIECEICGSKNLSIIKTEAVNMASADSLSFVVTAFPLRDILHLVSTSIRPPRRRCDNFPLV